MKLKNSNLVPTNCNDPFCDDKLDRKGFAVYLENLFKNIEEPFVACLNSDWGTGKTFFLLRLEKHLKNQGFGVIYFNAWENDFSDDALITLFSEFESGVKVNYPNQTISTKLRELKNTTPKLTKTGGIILSSITKGATGGVIDLEKIIKAFENATKESIKKYESAKKDIENFRKKLKELVNAIQTQRKNKHPLILIIDELDRCRPTFAIEILEKAKHFFSTEGIVFLFGANRMQLEKSVKAIYGQEYDAGTNNGYFRKFFDYEFSLPRTPREKYAEYLMDLLKVEESIEMKKPYSSYYNFQSFKIIVCDLFEAYKMTLREQEQFMTKIKMLIWSIPSVPNQYPPFIPLLLVFFEKHQHIYWLIKNNESIHMIIDKLKKDSIEIKSKQLYLLIYMSITNKNLHSYKELVDTTWRLIDDLNKMKPELISDNLETMEPYVNIYNEVRGNSRNVLPKLNYLSIICDHIENLSLYSK